MRVGIAGRTAVAVAGACVLGVLVAGWPATIALVAIVAVGVLLAWRMPPLGIVLGLAMLGFEGSIKVLLGLEDTPLPGGARAAGAAAIDIVLFAGVVAVLVRDRGRSPLAVWRRLGRAERAGVGLFAAWLALSVPQIAQSAHLQQGAAGFRLFQAYVLVGVAVAVLFGVPWFARRGVLVLLGLGLAVSAYAAVRVVVGPSHAEVAQALAASGTTMYGRTVRAVGSFSGAVGLNSYLVPLALFGLVLGVLLPRLRILAWAVTALSIVPIAASYARTPLFGILIALAFMLVVLLSTADLPVRRKLAVLGAAVAAVAATYGAIYLASRGAPILRRRAHGILHPFDDKSVRDRFDAWGRELHRLADQPLGAGVGDAGSSGASVGLRSRTPDNSFLKVLTDQGVLVGFAFVAGLLTIVVTIGRRLQRIKGEPRAVGLAALTGFVGFLGLCLVGEAVEQPGKAIAWALLGIALVVSVAPGPAPVVAEWIPSWSPAGTRHRLAGLLQPPWLAVGAVLVAVPVAVTLARAPGFEASVELVPRSLGPFPAVTDPSWYRRWLGVPAENNRVVRSVGLPAASHPYRTVRFSAAPNGRVRLSARLGSPVAARRFARAVAHSEARMVRTHLALLAWGARRPLLQWIRTDPPPPVRRTLSRYARTLGDLARAHPAPVTVGREVTLGGRRWGDRVVAALPHYRSPRPGAVWTALAGLVVAAALWAVALLLTAGRGGRPPRAGAAEPEQASRSLAHR